MQLQRSSNAPEQARSAEMSGVLWLYRPGGCCYEKKKKKKRENGELTTDGVIWGT